MDDDSSENYGTKGFEYVVDKSIRPPIFCGSKLHREVLPRKGPNLSTFMRYQGFEAGPSSKLMTYVPRPVSKGKNVTFGKAPRWTMVKSYQPPHRAMSPPPPKKKRLYIPFNSNTYRTPPKVNMKTPGPGLYNPNEKKMRIKYHHSFGGNRVIIPAVDIKCLPINYDECARCHINCGEQGDYWQQEDTNFLCRACFEKLYQKQSNRVILQTYKAIRDCSFAHFHQRSKNAIKLIGTTEIKKRILKEAYLSQFFSKMQLLKYTTGLDVD